MYAKLFSRITESSLMEEPINVRYVFVMMLAIADAKGYVIGTDVAIARRLNMPTNEFQRCVGVLMLPDEDSNSKDEEGRRIVASDGERGYRMVNYLTYREMQDQAQRRDYMRTYMREYRGGKQSVNSVNTGEPQLTQADASASPSSSEGVSEGGESRGEELRQEKATATELLKYLNQKAGRTFRPVTATLSLISARLKDPEVTPEGCRQMIERQVAMWGGTHMDEYLRPETLFGKTKFSTYYDNRELPLPPAEKQTEREKQMARMRPDTSKQKYFTSEQSI